ncbi:uncharacterized protein LOC128559947 isoform X1 [Mercenaria mercenaria]|uniref:uncharacterized protein LOC128559947 isoform X1 n=1 Tax=Mercenaria mercenaria TaxID=6596 RepID=UPI00234F4A41|nr:uncharacterized protein LOC128559947 isoform X1 [Mercenaria mercenaria]
MRELITLVLWLGICHRTFAAATFSCYSCSYTLSGDPTLDYECVTQPWNVTKGLPQVSCTTPNQCSTRASISTDKKQIRSVSRSCLTPAGICSGDNCCSTDGVYHTCEHKCRENMCNNRNAEEWLGQGGTSGAKGYHFSFIGTFIVLMPLISQLLYV